MKDPNDFMTGKGEPAWSLPMNRTELIARAEALEAALQLRCPQCDMRLLERTALETLVDLKDPHNAHHPDRLKGPGLTAPETGAKCQHDLLKPDVTVTVSWDARNEYMDGHCSVCGHAWHIPTGTPTTSDHK